MLRAMITALSSRRVPAAASSGFSPGCEGWEGWAEMQKPQSVAKTCAQIAIMPRNSASEASAAASSKTERNIASSIEHRGNIVHITFRPSRGSFFGVAPKRLRLHHQPIAQRDPPVHAAGDIHVVGRAEHGEAGRAHELGERLEHLIVVRAAGHTYAG